MSAGNDGGTNSVSCPLCQSKCRKLFGDLIDRDYNTPGKWDMQVCVSEECGLVHIEPMPTQEELAEAYRNYAIYSGTRDTAATRRRSGSKLRRAIRRWYTRITDHPLARAQFMMYLDEVSPGSALEIGCGDGARAAALVKKGWAVEGLELDERSAEVARNRHGLEVHVGGIESVDLGENRFDAIVMNHVIEHLVHPIDDMRKIHRALRPGGRFVCITPNADSYGARTFGRNWVGVDAPRHLYIFRPSSLRRLLSLYYEKVDVFASTVNSGMHLYASNRMRDPEPYRSGEEQGDEGALRRIRTLGIVARLRSAIGLGAGEEIVGIAYKSTLR